MYTQKPTTVSEYLRARDLVLDPLLIDVDPILENPELIKEASELWTAKEGLLKMVLQARINAIGRHIQNKAIPEEVVVYRQALVEIGALVNDFEKYKGIHGRNAQTKEDNSENATEQLADPTPEGEESSL